MGNRYFCDMENQRRQFALSLIAYAAQRDIPTIALCRYANVDLALLKSDSNYTISERQLDDLWFHASRLGNDSLFGLHFGESLQLAALGVVGEIIKSSRTVGEAISVAASLMHFVTDAFAMNVSRAKKNFNIQLIPKDTGADLPFAKQQLIDLLMVFVIHELDGLILEKIKPTAVVFPSLVSNAKEYTRVLRCAPSKRKGEYSIQFDVKYWDEPIVSFNYELQRFLLQKVQTMGVDNQSEDRYATKIYHYLMSNAYLGLLSLEDVAANFNVTPRSLQRKLHAEGATFQQLSDAVRKSLALHYLQSGKHQVKEISTMLGYNELSAFSRAFKRWTGKAPANYFP